MHSAACLPARSLAVLLLKGISPSFPTESWGRGFSRGGKARGAFLFFFSREAGDFLWVSVNVPGQGSQTCKIVQGNSPCKFSEPDWASPPCRCSQRRTGGNFKFLFPELGQEERSHSDLDQGAPATVLQMSFCLGEGCGFVPDDHRPGLAGGLCHSVASSASFIIRLLKEFCFKSKNDNFLC